MTVNRTQKAAETEAGMGTPEVEEQEYPDKVFGDTVFRWAGTLRFKKAKNADVYDTVSTPSGVRTIVRQIQEGTEEIPYSGFCAVCGKPVYILVKGDNVGAIGKQIAVFAPAGRNEPPVVYCLEHDPGAEHRSRATASIEDLDGTVIRFH